MVLICWGVIYEREQGMLRIEYRYKCPTVVRGRQSSPTTLDLESNLPQGSRTACSGHSYRPKLDSWQRTWPDHLLWGWLAVAWVHLPKHLEYRCCCLCDLCIKQVAHTSQLDGCANNNNNNTQQTVRHLTGVFGSLFWPLMTPKLDLWHRIG